MVLKVFAFENNEEKVIPLGDITGSVVREREVIVLTPTTSDTYTLNFTPQLYSEQVVINGLVMTEGATYDYVLSGNTITFQGGVLTQTGHVLINYSY